MNQAQFNVVTPKEIMKANTLSNLRVQGSEIRKISRDEKTSSKKQINTLDTYESQQLRTEQELNEAVQ